MALHFGDVLSVILGAAVIVFNRRWAEYQVGAQNRTWGFKMGPKAVTASRFVSVVVGAGFLVTGVLGLLGVVRARG